MGQGRRVAVTGLGVAASNGTGRDSFFKSCSQGSLGIKKCELFGTEKLMTDFFGEIRAGLPGSEVRPTDETRIKALIRLSLEECLSDSHLDRQKIASYGADAWLCFGTLLATTDAIMEYASGKRSGRELPGYLEHANDYLSMLRALCGVKGACYVSSAACAAATTSAGMAFDFIKNGMCELCVVGGADPLTKVSAAGFHALKSLSLGICNPYDEGRDGVNIGEGSAFFVFEELEAARTRGANIYAEVLGYGLTNDAYHITSPDPDGGGVIRAMEEAVSEAGLSIGDIDHINGHGTGTVVNDKMEIGAIDALFSDSPRPPSLTSTKSIVGHCMGASGAVELAAVLLSLQHQVYMPMPNMERPLETRCDVSSKGRYCEINYALSNSFAFAGNIASILIGRVRQ